ncbi:MAG: hypothetical protein V4574_19295 [Pseudomonadota bacterium]
MPALRPTLVLTALAGAVLPLSCAAQTAPATPAALQNVLQCRAVTDEKARLACFDSTVGQLDAARTSGAVVVVDREEVRKARRGLFGFSLPRLGLFGGGEKGGEDAEEIKEINGVARSATRNADGGWIITLEDGARWEQTGAMVFGRSPRPGSKVTIKRGVLGSFKMSVDGSPAVKARRIG